MEAIGAVASISQILGSLNILFASIQIIRNELKNAPQRIQQRQHHLSALISTLRLIETTPTLQTADVSVHLESIQLRVESLNHSLTANLQHINTKSPLRFLTALKSVKAEEHIFKSWQALADDKNNLLLYLQITHKQSLDQISEQAHAILLKMGRKSTANKSTKGKVAGKSCGIPVSSMFLTRQGTVAELKELTGAVQPAGEASTPQIMSRIPVTVDRKQEEEKEGPAAFPSFATGGPWPFEGWNGDVHHGQILENVDRIGGTYEDVPHKANTNFEALMRKNRLFANNRITGGKGKGLHIGDRVSFAKHS